MSSFVQALIASFAKAPDAPTIGTATATGQTTASVTFTAPSNNGGYPITSYTAISSPGNITATISQAGSGTINLTGLNSNTNYTFVVYATSAIGNSTNSSASNQITTQGSNVTFTAWTAVIGGGGGGGGVGCGTTGIAAGGGGGGGVNISEFTLEKNCVYCLKIGGGGTGGQGMQYSAPAFSPGYAATNGDNSFICQASAFCIDACGGGNGAGSYRTSPAGSHIHYEAGNNSNAPIGRGGGGGGGRKPQAPLTYGGAVGGTAGGGSDGPGTYTVNGNTGGGGGGAGGSGSFGVSCGAPLTTTQRAAINKGGDGGIGWTTCDSGNFYGTFGGGGGGARVACSATLTCVCYFLAPGGGVGGPFGGNGSHQFQTSGGQDGTCGQAPGGGGGGAGNAATYSNYYQTAPMQPSGAGGRRSGHGGAGSIIVSYPSDQPALTSISPTLTVSNGPTGTVANGRRYYCFTGGTGTITG